MILNSAELIIGQVLFILVSDFLQHRLAPFELKAAYGLDNGGKMIGIPPGRALSM